VKAADSSATPSATDPNRGRGEGKGTKTSSPIAASSMSVVPAVSTASAAVAAGGNATKPDGSPKNGAGSNGAGNNGVGNGPGNGAGNGTGNGPGNKQPPGLSVAAIASITTGCLVFIALVAAGTWLYVRRRRRRRQAFVPIAADFVTPFEPAAESPARMPAPPVLSAPPSKRDRLTAVARAGSPSLPPAPPVSVAASRSASAPAPPANFEAMFQARLDQFLRTNMDAPPVDATPPSYPSLAPSVQATPEDGRLRPRPSQGEGELEIKQQLRWREK
jgi:hypothetical protein